MLLARVPDAVRVFLRLWRTFSAIAIGIAAHPGFDVRPWSGRPKKRCGRDFLFYFLCG
jgi:hypothetical protein